MKTFFIYSGLGIVLGIVLGSVVIALTPPKADAQVSCAVYFCELLEQILQEEQKQTRLLDQIDCYNSYQTIGGYSFRVIQMHEHCGEPLNLSGNWKP